MRHLEQTYTGTETLCYLTRSAMKGSCHFTELVSLCIIFHAACFSLVAGFSGSGFHGNAYNALPIPSMSCRLGCNINRQRDQDCCSSLELFESQVHAAGARSTFKYPRLSTTRNSDSRLWMSMPAPPVKPTKRPGYRGGGDEFFVRELEEPEKKRLLNSWKAYAKADGGAKFIETIAIIEDMVRSRQSVAMSSRIFAHIS